MEITETRREQLRKWFQDRTIPPQEKSYLSQLMTGTASFGERAARRLERDYGMGQGYLDSLTAESHVSAVPALTPHAGKEEKPEAGDDIDLLWVTARGRKLLTLFYGTDEEGRQAIERTASLMPRAKKPVAVRNKT